MVRVSPIVVKKVLFVNCYMNKQIGCWHKTIISKLTAQDEKARTQFRISFQNIEEKLDVMNVQKNEMQKDIGYEI